MVGEEKISWCDLISDRIAAPVDLSSRTLELTNLEGAALHVSSQSSGRPI
jgi:hypothetical protein